MQMVEMVFGMALFLRRLQQIAGSGNATEGETKHYFSKKKINLAN